MALETAPDVTKIGCNTSGADGNIYNLYLPGDILLYFSGIGVYYPDGNPTQRIGIIPDIYIRPTIRGLREERDEVLEMAVKFIKDN